jgi:hypothetical protein
MLMPTRALFLAFASFIAFLPAAQSQPDKVVVVFKTHFDIGYTAPVENVLNRYRTEMIDTAMASMAATAEDKSGAHFSWTLPGWPMAQILWPGQEPARRQRVIDHLRSGSFVVHALPFTVETEHLDLEDLVRGFQFSSNIVRSMGQPLPRDAKMTDVPGHSWILPVLLHNAGVEFLHLGCNSASASPDVPPLFWWEGPDGSRVLTMYTPDGYGTGLIPPKNWPYKTWLALIHSGDNQGPPTPEKVRDISERAAKEMPNAKVVFGRLSDFADAILAEGAQIPVVRGDMADTWIHGIMSMPIETKLARNLRPQIAALESLNTLLGLWGVPCSSVKEAMAVSYENSLLYGEHTWGSSVMPFGYRYGQEWQEKYDDDFYLDMDSTFEDHGDYAKTVCRTIVPRIMDNMSALANAVAVEGPRIVVYNPLPWRRDAVVSAETPDALVAALRDDSGAVVPVQRRSWLTEFIARDLPPMGYRTYVPVDAPQPDGSLVLDPDEATMENKYFKIALDSGRGAIRSIIDKQSGRELIDSASEFAFGQYLYEQYDADDCEKYKADYCKEHPDWTATFAKPGLPPASVKSHSVSSPDAFECRMNCTPVAATAVFTAKETANIPHGTSLHVTLYRDSPYIDIEIGILAKKPDAWPEAGWLCLPFKIDDPKFTLGRVGAPVDPAKDIIRNSNFDMFCLATGVSISGADGSSVGMCPVDSPLISLGHRGIFKFNREWTPRTPTVFVNLFNNAWGCNYRQWCGGTWSSRVRIWCGTAGNASQSMLAQSWEARTPALTAYANAPAGQVPPSQTGLEIDRPGVLVTAFGPNPDGDGTIIRLWEQAGLGGACKIRLPEKLAAVQPKLLDLRGQPIGNQPPAQKNAATVQLHPYAPITLGF